MVLALQFRTATDGRLRGTFCACVFQDTVEGNRLKSHYKQNFACRSIDSDVIVYVGLITLVM
jgi:hypothetical protein